MLQPPTNLLNKRSLLNNLLNILLNILLNNLLNPGKRTVARAADFSP